MVFYVLRVILPANVIPETATMLQPFPSFTGYSCFFHFLSLSFGTTGLSQQCPKAPIFLMVSFGSNALECDLFDPLFICTGTPSSSWSCNAQPAFTATLPNRPPDQQQQRFGQRLHVDTRGWLGYSSNCVCCLSFRKHATVLLAP